MPNHFHAILEIIGANENCTGSPCGNPSDKPEKIGQPQEIGPTKPLINAPANKTVSDIIGAFESITTVEYIRGVKNNNWESFNGKLWQRNYWEHIVRNEQSYNRISEYIINNPTNWNNDTLFNG